jgi:hypothetical protein
MNAEHRYFLSPSGSVDPSELDSYDMSGEWAAEQKQDGFAARVVTDGRLVEGFFVDLCADCARELDEERKQS